MLTSFPLFSLFQYLSEANEVSTWMKEKLQGVASQDYGRDENAADKLLTKHKVHTYPQQQGLKGNWAKLGCQY